MAAKLIDDGGFADLTGRVHGGSRELTVVWRSDAQTMGSGQPFLITVNGQGVKHGRETLVA